MSAGQFTLNLVAGETIRPNRLITVDTSADHTANEANDNEYCVGITTASTVDYTSDNHATSGDPVSLQTGLVMYVEAGGSITAGDLLIAGGTNTGKAVTAGSSGTTIQEVFGTALEDGADGEIIRIKWAPQKYRPDVS